MDITYTIDQLTDEISNTTKKLKDLKDKLFELKIINKKSEVYDAFFNAAENVGFDVQKLMPKETFISENISIFDFFAVKSIDGVVYLFYYNENDSLYVVDAICYDTKRIFMYDLDPVQLLQDFIKNNVQ